MKSSLLVCAVLPCLALPAAMAAEVPCPDLATAVQVGACPAEEELRHTFTGYCSDDAKTYRGETDVCTDYQRYRRLKNVALWESADEKFNAYVSCDRPQAEVKSARVSAVRVGKQGSMTLLVCSYGNSIDFTLRTRAECRVDGGTAKCG
ncbi:hypothetical protein [Sulfuritalea sp.]|uniref:hypothetical protein n=1 Tax=Sulfuritalea sp. TaxID=2480090 RepID=UPI00286E00B2|nr:hypothetical protein [Sulfuritalea sp.]